MDEPAVEKVDWQLGLAMYLRGHSYADICAETKASRSALAKRAQRHRWPELKDRLNNAAANGAKMTVAARGAAVRELVAAEIHQSAGQLESLPRGKGLDSFEKRASAVSTLVTTSDKIFGWSESARPVNAVFNFNLLDSARLLSRERLGDCIDVTTPAPETEPEQPSEQS